LLSFRVLIVEDFDPFRQFILSTLRENPQLQIVGEATDGLDAVQKAEELKPDLILLDIGLPNLNGIEAKNRICKLLPDTKIIFLSQDNDPEIVGAVLSNGAQGYVLKVDVGNELLPAIKAVLRGERFVSSGVKRERR
jgi:DNA-binding NarL/FixJ family response regulator